MCATSTVIDNWTHPTWPIQPIPHNPVPPGITIPAAPNAIPWPLIQQDPALAQQMLEVLKRLEALDKRLGKMEQCAVTLEQKRKLKARLRRVAKKAQP